MELNCAVSRKQETLNNNNENEAEEYLKHLLTNGCNEYTDDGELYLPDWYNAKAFASCQNFVNKYRMILLAGMLSGLIAVLSIPSILKVLICTHQSGNAAMAYRRYVRTIFHVLAWHDYPLEQGSKSWQSIENVRRMHGKSNNICQKSIAVGITQKDLAITQFGFMGFISLGAEKVGIKGDEFFEHLIHFWRVIGHLLGIKDEYNLCTDSWATTEPRLKLMLQEIYKPALQSTDDDFEKMTKALIDGLWPVSTGLTWESAVFLTKRSAECKGFEYFNQENFGDGNDKQSEYYKLSFYQRFLVSYAIFITTTLYKFDIFRIYINFRIYTNMLLMYYCPILAMLKFGFKWSFVRIFKDNEEKFHRD